MIEVMADTNIFLSSFDAFARTEAAAGPAWMRETRRAAISRFAALGFPTTRLEDWQYTNVAPLARIPFVPGACELRGLSREKVGEISLVGLKCNQIVFVNGIYAQELSCIQGLPAGVRVGSLAAALADSPPIEPYLAKHAGFHEHAFVALNTAFIQDGALLLLPGNTQIKDPIHLIFISTALGAPSVSQPRNLIVVGEGSRATIIESYAGLRHEVYFTNAVTEIIAGENSVVDHYKVQRESEKAFHVATLQVHQGKNSSFTTCSITLGGGLVRNDVNVTLDGEGAECALNGLYLVAGRQHVDNHTCIDHAKPSCTSRELYKGVLDGQSSGVFNGRVIVRPDAQKTNARQTNKNLLLSEHAVIDTKPQLEICADDVKCAHGATIGQLDENALYYMRSRGIDRQTACNLLVHAFGGEIIGGIAVREIQCQLDLIMLHRLSGASRVKETV